MHLGRIVGLLGLGGAALLIAPNAAAADSDDDTKQDDSSDKASGDKDSSDSEASPKASTPAELEAERYAYLNAELKHVEASTERWFAGWTCGFAALALGQYSLAASAPNDGLRAFSIVGAINTTLAFGAMVIAPNTLVSSREKLDNFDATMPQGMYERRRRAEYYLHATTAEEKYWHGPIPIVLAAITSGIGGAILMTSYKDTAGGIATIASGIAVTGLQMLTRPSAAQAAWKRYSNRYHPTPNSQTPPDQVDLFLSFAVTPTSASMTLSF
ncbi:MAG TPA: hypothetical protein VH044_15575 [Polyangiaceae bacterium]|jgi:hypothetical protein|nr:hypothetical protein [Polyangiaceae bacterium]